MRTLVVGDVHACVSELAALVELASPSRIVMVGDLFTKGPDPVGTWRFLMDHGALAVLGNHDERLLQWRRGERPGDAEAEAVCGLLDDQAAGWLEWLYARPLCLTVGRYLVTHASLHPSGELERTDRDMFLYRRTWPGPDGPRFWWEIYEGPPVIFGHDARRGLVRRDRDGRPWIVGLDTGCVYGGALSGWLVEEEQLFQVPAAQIYKPV